MRFEHFHTFRSSFVSITLLMVSLLTISLSGGLACFSPDDDTDAHPDLVVTPPHTPENPTDVDMVTFTATVTNEGDVTAGTCTLEFTIGGEITLEIYQIPELAPDTSYDVTRQMELTAQNYGYSARVDSDEAVSELDENNNEASSTFSVIVFVNDADLGVSSQTLSPVNPTTTDLITFTAVVTNSGTTSAGASTLKLCVGGESTSPLFQFQPLAPAKLVLVSARKYQMPS